MSEIAWAAGFFDGEGTTCCNRGSFGGRQLQVSLGQVNRNNLIRFRSAVGDLGGIGNPRSFPGRQPISRYAVYGSKAQSVLQLLWPFLSEEKRNQALDSLIAYAFRPISHRQRSDGGVCRRGHDASAGVYGDPRGRRECAVCRRARRHGKLGPPPRPLAIELGVGIRQYVPPNTKTARAGVAWTFGLRPSEYRPAVET